MKDFAGCVKLTDDTVKHLSKCPQLQSVNLSSLYTDMSYDDPFYGPHALSLTNRAAEYLAACPQLRSVNLSDCEELTDDIARH